MNNRPPRQVTAGTPRRPVVIHVFSEGSLSVGEQGWKEKSVETPYVPPAGVDCSVPQT